MADVVAPLQRHVLDRMRESMAQIQLPPLTPVVRVPLRDLFLDLRRLSYQIPQLVLRNACFGGQLGEKADSVGIE